MTRFNRNNQNRFIRAWTDTIQQIMREDSRTAYFVTVTLVDIHPSPTNIKSALELKAEFAWQHYGRFNRHLNSLLESNFTTKLYRLPLTFDFFDIGGTRHSQPIFSYEPKTPHIHSIYLVHPANLTRFKILLQNRFDEIVEHRSQKAIIQVHATPIGTTPEDLCRVVSYASKLLFDPMSQALPDQTILYTQYPITRDDLKARRTRQERFHVDPRQALLSASKARMLKSFGALGDGQ